MRKEYREQKNHYKMYKAGKTWLFAGIGAITLASAVTLTSPEAHADEVQADTSSLAVKTATNKQENIDDAQANVDQDVKDINDNKNVTTDEQANHDNLSGQTDSKQDAANQAKDDAASAQNDADKANDQVSDDKNNVDNLTPGDDYKTAEDNADKAQADVNKDQKAANDAKDDVDEANQAVDDATKANDTAKGKADAAKNAKDDAKNKADDAKNTLDNTDKTKKVHHDGNPVKPGTFDEGELIDSEDQLPDTLIDPKDGHTDDIFYRVGSWYAYNGIQDTTQKIDIDHLTQAQVDELGQYALALINSFRKQHGLPPMIMSDGTQKMTAGDVAIRNKNGITTDHSLIEENITESDWNNYTFNQIMNNHAGVLFAAQNLGFFNGFESTMLEAKVSILAMLTAMAYDDGAQGNYHTQAMLMNPGNDVDSIYSDDDDNPIYYFGFGHQADGNAAIFDFWRENNSAPWNDGNSVTPGANGHNDFASALLNNQQTAYTNKGYDTTESNPDYTKALNTYNAAASALKDANANYTKAIANANNTAAGVKQAKSNLANAQIKLADAKQALTDAQAKLAQAQDTLAQMQAKYADQVKAYEAAKDQLAKDQKVADTANAKLADATKALNAANTALKANKDAIAKSQAHLDQLADELNALQAKLVADEVSLAAAKVAPDDVTPDDNNDAKDNGNNTPTNNDDGKDTPTNNSDKNNATTNNAPTDKTNNGNADHTAANHVTPSENTSTDNVVNLDTKTNNHVVTPLTTHATTVKNNVNIADTNTTTLPQTGERDQHAEMAMGWIGLIISALGLAGITRRKRS